MLGFFCSRKITDKSRFCFFVLFFDGRFNVTPLVNRYVKSSSGVPVIREIQKEMRSGQDGISTCHPILPTNYNKNVWRKSVQQPRLWKSEKNKWAGCGPQSSRNYPIVSSCFCRFYILACALERLLLWKCQWDQSKRRPEKNLLSPDNRRGTGWLGKRETFWPDLTLLQLQAGTRKSHPLHPQLVTTSWRQQSPASQSCLQ